MGRLGWIPATIGNRGPDFDFLKGTAHDCHVGTVRTIVAPE